MPTNFLVGTATPVTLSSTHHIPKNPNYEYPPDWLRFLWHLYSIPKICQPLYLPHPQGSTPFFCLRT